MNLEIIQTSPRVIVFKGCGRSIVVKRERIKEHGIMVAAGMTVGSLGYSSCKELLREIWKWWSAQLPVDKKEEMQEKALEGFKVAVGLVKYDKKYFYGLEVFQGAQGGQYVMYCGVKMYVSSESQRKYVKEFMEDVLSGKRGEDGKKRVVYEYPGELCDAHVKTAIKWQYEELNCEMQMRNDLPEWEAVPGVIEVVIPEKVEVPEEEVVRLVESWEEYMCRVRMVAAGDERIVEKNTIGRDEYEKAMVGKTKRRAVRARFAR